MFFMQHPAMRTLRTTHSLSDDGKRMKSFCAVTRGRYLLHTRQQTMQAAKVSNSTARLRTPLPADCNACGRGRIAMPAMTVFVTARWVQSTMME